MLANMYVSVTDLDWFNFIREGKFTEVNFWRPGSSNFKALKENELFLFKLHKPNDYIVGGGFFESYSYLPTFLAWSAFGKGNGVNSLQDLNQKIQMYRARNKVEDTSLQIGCILLNDVFCFDETDWIQAPANWKNSIVQGKTYSTNDIYGARLYQEISERLQNGSPQQEVSNRFSYSMTKYRLGQGAFRIGVANAYGRKCAISGEKTLPVLEAAHIKPVENEGPYQISNGIFLRSDIHILFDKGYITVDDDYMIDVSRHLHEDFGNGKDYYKYQGGQIYLPGNPQEMPSKAFLNWHNENIFIG